MIARCSPRAILGQTPGTRTPIGAPPFGRDGPGTGSDGSSPTTRVQDCSGSGWSGEIVACGQGTARSAVDAWIGSPGHNEIMFTPGQQYIGVAMYNNFWTAIFDR